MKNFSKKIMTVLLATGCTMVVATVAAPASQSNLTQASRSVFILPSSPGEGRDPFFPDSTRPYKLAAAVNPRAADVIIAGGERIFRLDGPPICHHQQSHFCRRR